MLRVLWVLSNATSLAYAKAMKARRNSMLRRPAAYFAAIGAGCLLNTAARGLPLFYVSTYIDNKIYAVQPDGSTSVFLNSVGGGGAMTTDSLGNIYHANYDVGTISKI